eukprot:2525205-Prymnesium_polylepis.2
MPASQAELHGVVPCARERKQLRARLVVRQDCHRCHVARLAQRLDGIAHHHQRRIVVRSGCLSSALPLCPRPDSNGAVMLPSGRREAAVRQRTQAAHHVRMCIEGGKHRAAPHVDKHHAAFSCRWHVEQCRAVACWS